MEIKYKFSPNFLGDTIAYSANLKAFLAKYADQFPGLHEIYVELKELSYYQIGHDKTPPIQFLNDNKLLEIKLTFHHYYDIKGRKTGSPSAYEVYDQLKFILERAAEEYRAVVRK